MSAIERNWPGPLDAVFDEPVRISALPKPALGRSPTRAPMPGADGGASVLDSHGMAIQRRASLAAAIASNNAIVSSSRKLFSVLSVP